MSGESTAELSQLLRRLNARAAGEAPSRPPTPDEAMALYFVATRLVELQLEVDGLGLHGDDDSEITREVLRGTRQMLTAALDVAEREEAERAAAERAGTRANLVVVDGGKAPRAWRLRHRER